MRNKVLTLLVLAFVCTLAACRQRISTIPISDASFTLGPDWVDLPLAQPLTAEWQDQVVLVTVTTKFSPSTRPLGLSLPDGAFVKPEIDATTDKGTHQPFQLQWFRNPSLVAFENDSVPKGTRFVRLRMRCSAPLAISKVTWVSYMPQDSQTGYP